MNLYGGGVKESKRTSKRLANFVAKETTALACPETPIAITNEAYQNTSMSSMFTSALVWESSVYKVR